VRLAHGSGLNRSCCLQPVPRCASCGSQRLLRDSAATVASTRVAQHFRSFCPLEDLASHNESPGEKALTVPLRRTIDF
jgi:hypothetical protein